MDHETIDLRIEDGIGWLCFNRPKALNAFDPQLIEEFGRAMAELTRDDAVNTIIVHGAGRAFSAGFDIKASANAADRTVAEWREVLEADFDFIMQFWDCPKPTIAAVHGYCLAGAFEVMLACDITVAGEAALFGEPEVRFGSGIVAMLLPWMTGPKAAKELLLTGQDRISAARAERLGLVNHVVPDGEVLARAEALARDIVAAAPASVLATKRAINRSYEIMGMRQALLQALEADIMIEFERRPRARRVQPHPPRAGPEGRHRLARRAVRPGVGLTVVQDPPAMAAPTTFTTDRPAASGAETSRRRAADASGHGHRLDPLLAPDSVALVGASTRPESAGNAMVRMPRLAGFAGRLYPVNPAYAEVEGLPCHPSLSCLPETVDHVVLGLANSKLEAGLAEAIAHGARAVTIFASGYVDGDTGLGRRLGDRARAAGVALCGGNGMGFYNLDRQLRISAFDAPLDMRRGPVAFIAQSGSAFGALAHNDRRLGFNLAVSSGSEWATTAADYLDWALEQETTGVVGLFLETVRDPAGFVAGLEKAAARSVPVVVLKVGRTPESAAMALSHTGALAGSDAAYEALFDRYGVIRVDDEDELAATLLLLSHPRRPAAGGLAAMHDSGGERELMVDINTRVGVPFARIGPVTADRLAAHLDPGLAPVNPLDAWGTGADVIDSFAALMEALVEDPDAALGVLFADIRDGYYLSEKYAAAMLAAARRTQKPIAIATNYSLVRHEAIALRLTEAGVPVLDGTANALRAVRHLLAFRDSQAVRGPAGPSPLSDADRARWRERLAGGDLDESGALDLLDAYGISTPARHHAESRADAIAAAAAIGYPVALKTAAPGIAHKTEAGGVRLGLRDAAEVAEAWDSVAGRLGPRVLVQAMAGRGVEAALGAVVDPDFGPYAMVASGGVLIELLEDRAVSLAPLAAGTAERMIGRLKLSRLLSGVRGAPPADAAALAGALRRLSHLAADFAELIAEVDVNPVIVGPSGIVAVDALVVRRRPGVAGEGEG